MEYRSISRRFPVPPKVDTANYRDGMKRGNYIMFYMLHPSQTECIEMYCIKEC